MGGLTKKGPARRERKSGRHKQQQNLNVRGMPVKQAALNSYLSPGRDWHHREDDSW